MSFQIVPDQLEEVEDDVNIAVAVAVAASTNRNALIEIGINDEDETPMSQSMLLDGQPQSQQICPPDTSLPDDVQSYLIGLNESLNRRDVDRIRNFHEHTHNNLTFKYYMKTRWPSVSTVENLIESFSYNSMMTRFLYTEQYYRHVFAKFPNNIKWQDRVSSWRNYIALFNYLIFNCYSNIEPQNMQLPITLIEYFKSYELNTKFEHRGEICLPPEMIHSIIDEFLYQFQDTCRYRARVAHVISISDHNLNEGRSAKIDQDIWRCDIILLIFQSLVDLSKIRLLMTNCDINQQEQLQNLPSTDFVTIEYQLGYFSIIGLLRLHSLLGNYHTAIEISNGIDIPLFRPLLWKATTAYVSYLYYLGFSYLMLQRYIDAIRIFQQSTVSFASSAISSINSSHSSPYQHDAIGKFVDRMSWLMLFCQLLSYGNNSSLNRMEESLSHQNDRKPFQSFSPFGSDISNWKDLLLKVSPRFISPSIPIISSKDQMIKVDQNEPQQRQIQTFSPLVQLFELNSMIRSFTKLYNNLNVDTLASLMHIAKRNSSSKSREVIKSRNGGDIQYLECPNNDSLYSTLDDFEVQEPSSIARSQIIAIKSRSGRQRIWKTGENLLFGELVSLSGDADLLLDLDTIHIIEGKQVDKFFGDIFAKQILKARNLLRHIDSLSNKNSDISSKREKA
ncbi:eukaryotic translation initiation factor 3 subunit 6 interacting protein [Cryptosporidium felis]|nr:eukaryotic translation initiation factor 3 subunit 6 interacting protein [Cryptosporidium felis]